MLCDFYFLQIDANFAVVERLRVSYAGSARNSCPLV